MEVIVIEKHNFFNGCYLLTRMALYMFKIVCKPWTRLGIGSVEIDMRCIVLLLVLWPINNIILYFLCVSVLNLYGFCQYVEIIICRFNDIYAECLFLLF